jgi:hypothetical protein
MDLRLDDRRGNAFSQVLASIDAAEAQQPAVIGSFKQACHKAVSETPLLLISLAVAALCLLLLVRPAFVLKFEQDQRRPWRGCTRVSWCSVVVAVLLVALTPLLLRFVMSRSSP